MVRELQGRPTWEEFHAHFDSSAPLAIRLSGRPTAVLFVESLGSRIGVRLDWDGQHPPGDPQLAAITVNIVSLQGSEYLEVATGEERLYPHFFAFALSIANAVQIDRMPVDQALSRSLREWRSLFERLPLLTEQQEVGLLGELWVLGRLIHARKAATLDVWTGPQGEAHDFRLGSDELEVKATTSENRVHVISSESQLTPSPGHSLHLISLQFAASGPQGTSLHDRIVHLQTQTAAMGIGARFDGILESAFNLTSQNIHLYSRRFQLRSRPSLIAVEDPFPRITRGDLLGLPRRDMQRVSDVQYRVDVNGLGWEDGTPRFLKLLPEEPVNG